MLTCLALCVAMPLTAQVAVRGAVHDSLTGRPFAGALVQLVPSAAPWSAGLTTTSDSAGRYALPGVTAGRYTLGFTHPRLDSLGYDAVTKVLDIATQDGTMTADLALPGAASLRASLCGERSDSTGVVLGRIREAVTDSAVTSAVAVAEWAELVVGTTGLERRARQVNERVGRDGRFVLCGVPTNVVLQLRAVSTDSALLMSSGMIDVRVDDASPLLHRDFLLTPPAARAASGIVSPPTSARLAGRVTDQAARPVTGATIRIRQSGVADSLVTTDSAGAYRFSALRGGTYTVEVGRIGLMPHRGVVDLRPGVQSRADFVLGTPPTELARVTVTARAGFEHRGFEQRRLRRRGFFMTGDDVSRSDAMVASRMLMSAPMLTAWGSNAAGRPVLTGPLRCPPTIFLDGVHQKLPESLEGRMNESAFPQPPATLDLDNLVSIFEIGGIEVYAPNEAPGRFAVDPSCSTIVIWSKQAVGARPQ